MFALPDFRGWLLFSSFVSSHSLSQYSHFSLVSLTSVPSCNLSLSLCYFLISPSVVFFFFSWTPHICCTCFFLISVHKSWVPQVSQMCRRRYILTSLVGPSLGPGPPPSPREAWCGRHLVATGRCGAGGLIGAGGGCEPFPREGLEQWGRKGCFSHGVNPGP